MLARTIAPTARLVSQRPTLLAGQQRAFLNLSSRPTTRPAFVSAFALAQKRTYANQPGGTSEHAGSPVTSTSHPTVPKTPPKVSERRRGLFFLVPVASAVTAG